MFNTTHKQLRIILIYNINLQENQTMAQEMLFIKIKNIWSET